MNIQLPSNTVNNGRENYTNDFEIQLTTPIDALNREAYIVVKNVMYPNTICNVVNDDDVYFSLTLNFENFSNHKNLVLFAEGKGDKLINNEVISYVNKGRDDSVKIKTGKIQIKKGVYNLTGLLDIINSKIREYNAQFEVGINDRIRIKWNAYYEFWLKQEFMTNGDKEYKYTGTKMPNAKYTQKKASVNKFLARSAKSYDGGELNEFHVYNYKKADENNDNDEKVLSKFQFNSLVTLDLNFSDSLRYMLGFSNDLHLFTSINYYNKIIDPIIIREAEYLHDIRNGVNKAYIYCEQLENSIVGNTSAELLCIIPLEKSLGKGEVVLYEPAEIKRKFKKSYIQNLKFLIKDSTGQPISFDYGNVNIEGVIY